MVKDMDNPASVRHPLRARLLPAIFLLLVAGYHGSAWVDLITKGDNIISKTTGNIFWPTRWRMFNGYSSKGRYFQIEYDTPDGWVSLDLAQHYPFQWCHGHRWQRGEMKKRASFRRPFLAAACTHVETPRVRMVQKKWRLKPGRFQPTPPASAKSTPLEVWECSKPAPDPGGVVF